MARGEQSSVADSHQGMNKFRTCRSLVTKGRGVGRSLERQLSQKLSDPVTRLLRRWRPGPQPWVEGTIWACRGSLWGQGH